MTGQLNNRNCSNAEMLVMKMCKYDNCKNAKYDNTKFKSPPIVKAEKRAP